MNDTLLHSPLPTTDQPGLPEAWQLVLGRLRPEMTKALFETWVEPLRPLSLRDGVVTLGAANPYGRDWVESRLKSSLTRLLEGVYGVPLNLQVVVSNGFVPSVNPAADVDPADTFTLPDSDTSEPAETPGPAGGAPKRERDVSKRKSMLQRAYGSRRAAVVQPERGMFLTLYFFNQWLPLLGHSAATIILAARSMCYWNPLTGEMRNTIDTEMGELAQRAAVSVRTVKEVLASDLVQRYFLRYRVRRIMTPNGVRTAGITLLVRMDDPLTPTNQAEFNLPEDERWYTAEFDPEEDD